MKVGVHVPQWGAGADRRGVLDVARCAEGAGLDSVWVADHVVFPESSTSVYPYRRGGLPFEAGDGFLEALTTLAVIAGATDRIGLGTSVLVLAMREPLLAAKSLATLDVLSGGRVTVAVGAGWWAEEFAALGAGFEPRGDRLDESLGALRTAWTTGRVQGAGGSGVVACEPRPVQPGGPPLLVGGMGRRARRRAAELGDGWHAVGADVDRLRQGMAEVGEMAAAAGRDPATVVLTVSCGMPDERERALDRVEALRAAGVSHAVLNFRAGEPAGLCASVERFAAEVLPALVES